MEYINTRASLVDLNLIIYMICGIVLKQLFRDRHEIVYFLSVTSSSRSIDPRNHFPRLAEKKFSHIKVHLLLVTVAVLEKTFWVDSRVRTDRKYNP